MAEVGPWKLYKDNDRFGEYMQFEYDGKLGKICFECDETEIAALMEVVVRDREDRM